MTVVFAIVALLLSACTTPSSSPSPSTTPTPAPATPPASEPITLKLGSDSVPVAYFNKAADWWAKEVEKATAGRVKIEQYHAGAIAKMDAALESLNSGLVDVYILSVTGLSSFMPVSQVLCLPGQAFPTTIEGKVASCSNYLTLIEKYPALATEWKDVKILYPNPGPTFNIISRGKEFRVPSEIAGAKIGALGSRQDLMKILGAAPVAAPPPQAYQMMQTGVVDGFCMPWVAINDFQLWEVAKYNIDADTGESGMIAAISPSSWNKISPQDQKIIMDVSSKAPEKSAEFLLGDTETAMKKFTDYGRTIITLTPQERAQWQEKSQIYWDEWKSKLEAKGVSGLQDLIDARKSASDAAWAKK